MAKFFVGQRVRVVGAEIFTEVIGTSTTVTAVGVSAWNTARKCVESGMIQVSLRCPTEPDKRLAFRDYFLEPVLPEGAQPLGYSFEQMMSEFGVTEAVK